MFKLFAGTANPLLAEKVAAALGVSVSKSEVVRFDNSEVRVRVEESVKDHNCVIVQPTSNPTDTNLMELFFFCDALRRQEAKRVVGVVPYFGYGRQDREHRVGECVSANVVIRFMQAIGFAKIYSFDLHDEATGGVFHIPFRNISAIPILVDEVKSYLQGNVSQKEIAIVSPDQGGVERARTFGSLFFGTEEFNLVVTEKMRDNNRLHQSKAVDIYGDVRDKVAVLVDDMTTSAGSLVHAAELCRQAGAKRIIAVVTHHDFSENAPRRLENSSIEICICTDTIALPEKYAIPKIKEITVSNIIADRLKYLMS
jgi:ribose-phosphate pyrophosphokinase